MARESRNARTNKPRTDQGGINSAEGNAPSNSGKISKKAGRAPSFGSKENTKRGG